MAATSPLGPPRSGNEPTLYDAVGGMPFFVQLVEHFYRGVEADPTSGAAASIPSMTSVPSESCSATA